MDLMLKRHFDEMKEDGTSSFTIEDIRQEVDTFLFGGFDTTSTALMWTLHLLGNHPEIQQKAYEEIISII
ncbi:cytochrome P450 4V2-like protein, partial [Leptotrombidium deliense]